ncbi:SCF ubiquitin ligase complex subunit [Sporothrix eucalyptigena]|uniref:SCF ubiquitin ligase complex subunit n=1 Tax=Sporothrix eucalyptigena TaxID=1812306 RepID=A0ABP0CJL4_9PEZI
MATPPPERDHPSGQPVRRQQVPSLDVMAAQPPSTPSTTRADESEPAAAGAIQESRSSSSTNSPLPNDNEESDFFLGPNDSESSLGVSNLQDMQVNDTAEDICIPPVNRLPNEILISIFARLGSSADLMHCLLTCKRWARNSVDLLWHRPACTNWTRHKAICQTLTLPNQYFHYKDFIKRLNLASIADKVNDGSVLPLAVCNRIERLTLTNCKNLTDSGLIPLVQDSSHLLALDISGDEQITEATLFALAEHCRRLQGLNVSSCTKISNEGMIKLAESCKYIKRIKLNDCSQLTDEAVTAFAMNCPNILEIDLHQCRLITNQPITDLLAHGQALRELRLANCELISDSAFLSLPNDQVYEHLRILDLTSCVRLTDSAVDRIITVAPRLRNLVLAKCRNITDNAVHSIARLGKNLHYVHLGHCSQITDEAVKRLVHACNRIRYIDLGCCVHLTDDSVTRLATLPKLKRIGLVKCSNITDESVNALAKANQRHRQRRDVEGNIIEHYYSHSSSLERVHLSYCTNLTIRGIIKLLNACHRLTHLSLTGVPAFLREDLSRFCRSPPAEFTMHQREVFCVFSGEGVSHLRDHLNGEPGYAPYRDNRPVVLPAIPAHHRTVINLEGQASNVINGQMLNFDETEADAPTDDDTLDEGNDMVIDVNALPGIGHVQAAGNGIPVPPLPNHGVQFPVVGSTLTPTALPFMPGNGYAQVASFPTTTTPTPQQMQHMHQMHHPNAHIPPGLGGSVNTAPMPPAPTGLFGNAYPQPMQFPSTASTAHVRAPVFQQSYAGPSAAFAQQNPAPMATVVPVAAPGASTATLTGPSPAQPDGTGPAHTDDGGADPSSNSGQ